MSCPTFPRPAELFERFEQQRTDNCRVSMTISLMTNVATSHEESCTEQPQQKLQIAFDRSMD
jgi:hypothetical protein